MKARVATCPDPRGTLHIARCHYTCNNSGFTRDSMLSPKASENRELSHASVAYTETLPLPPTGLFWPIHLIWLGLHCFRAFISIPFAKVSLTLTWGVCQVTPMTNNFVISVTSWHLAFQVHLLMYLGMRMFNNVVRCMPLLDNGPPVD